MHSIYTHSYIRHNYNKIVKVSCKKNMSIYSWSRICSSFMPSAICCNLLPVVVSHFLKSHICHAPQLTICCMPILPRPIPCAPRKNFLKCLSGASLREPFSEENENLCSLQPNAQPSGGAKRKASRILFCFRLQF